MDSLRGAYIIGAICQALAAPRSFGRSFSSLAIFVVGFWNCVALLWVRDCHAEPLRNDSSFMSSYAINCLYIFVAWFLAVLSFSSPTCEFQGFSPGTIPVVFSLWFLVLHILCNFLVFDILFISYGLYRVPGLRYLLKVVPRVHFAVIGVSKRRLRSVACIILCILDMSCPSKSLSDGRV